MANDHHVILRSYPTGIYGKILRFALPFVLFALCLLVLLLTTAPTIYNFDSVEFAIGAATLGIVHAPGYPLYLVIAHVFTWLPVGDLGYRVNLFSALSLALAVPFVYALLDDLVRNRAVAVAAALAWVWSYYVWGAGVVAEIYAPQLLTLAVCGWWLVRLYRRPDRAHPRAVIGMGVWFGIAAAMHPVSLLFAPGLVLAFRPMRIPWRGARACSCFSARWCTSLCVTPPGRISTWRASTPPMDILIRSI
jgi:hypothetical protein